MRISLLVLCYVLIFSISEKVYATDPPAVKYVWAFGIPTLTTSGSGPVINSMVADNEGNIYAVGSFFHSTDLDPNNAGGNLSAAGYYTAGFVVKYDSTGQYIWGFRIGSGSGGHRVNSITLDRDQNLIVAGEFSGVKDFNPQSGSANLTSYYDGSTYGNSAFLAKYTRDGEYIWAYNITGNSSSQANAVTTDRNGNVYVTGECSGNTTIDLDPGPDSTNFSSSGTVDIFMAKYDSLGNYQWGHVIGGYSYDIGKAIATDTLGNVYVTGAFRSLNVDFDPGLASTILSTSLSTYDDIFLVKFDTDGIFNWAFSIGAGGTAYDVANAIAVNDNQEVFIAGKFEGTIDFDPGPSVKNKTSNGDDDAFIAKYDSDGNYLWAFNIGSTYDNDDVIYSMVLDTASNVYVAGSFVRTTDFDPGSGYTSYTTYQDTRDGFIAKYSTDGEFRFATAIGKPGQGTNTPGTERCYALCYDNNEHIVFGGSFLSTTLGFYGANNLTHTSITNQYSDAFICKMAMCAAGNPATTSLSTSILCQGDTINLSFSSSASTLGENLYWAIYSDTCGGTLVGNSFPIDITPQVSGRYYFRSEGGCFVPSTCYSTAQITVDSIPNIPSISFDNGLLETDATTGIKWYMDGVQIPGANQSIYSPSQNGDYYVEVGNGLCKVYSDTLTLMTVGLSEISKRVNIYPNPAIDNILLDLPANFDKNSQLKIIDITGRIVLQARPSKNIDISELSAGMYSIIIHDKNEIVNGHFVKK